jgi:restriction system protein
MKKYYKYNNVTIKTKIIAFLCALYLWGLLMNILFNQSKVLPMIIYLIVVLVLYFGWKSVSRAIKDNRIKKLIELIQQRGEEEYLKNFINRFSFEGKSIDGWEFRNRKIDWYRIEDLEKYLLEKGFKLKTGKGDRDIFKILTIYIQKSEENLTRESIKTEPQKYSNLSGTDFEKLLYRLFQAMGYSVEHIGHSGDQGGDLIANKNGERILIQAKCYRDWSVGNEAVQQVVGAMKFYNCNKTMVITTSAFFTPEAHSLAKANNTELISKDPLSQMLMEYLHENWG